MVCADVRRERAQALGLLCPRPHRRIHARAVEDVPRWRTATAEATTTTTTPTTTPNFVAGWKRNARPACRCVIYFWCACVLLCNMVRSACMGSIAGRLNVLLLCKFSANRARVRSAPSFVRISWRCVCEFTHVHTTWLKCLANLRYILGESDVKRDVLKLNVEHTH